MNVSKSMIVGATVAGILTYAFTSQKLLQFEGFETEFSEFFGSGQLSFLAIFLWMSLSSIDDDPTDNSLLMLNVVFLGPIVAAVAFYKIGSRILRKVQRTPEACT